MIRSEGTVGEFRVNPSRARTAHLARVVPLPPQPRATRAAPLKSGWVSVQSGVRARSG